MISIIISSAKAEMLLEVSKNIKSTIGIPYELLSYDNARGKESICSIYNRGANDARYDILCFMHEDIDIKTINWGTIVINCFMDNSNLGVLGVVGSSYKSKAPTGWGAESSERSVLYYNYIQGFKNLKPSKHYIENPEQEELSKVVSVDGMWFCTPRTLWKEHPFDEEMLTGFHCYDLDYCFQIGQNYNIAVTYNILIEHYSEGAYSPQWWDSTLKLHKKWNSILPAAVHDLSEEHRFLIEKRAYRWAIWQLSKMGYSWTYINIFLLTEIRKGNIGLTLYFKGIVFSVKCLVYRSQKRINNKFLYLTMPE